MAFFVWDDKYSVGVRELDQQHKQLFNILNELFDAMQARKANEVMGKIIGELINYTKLHFSTEEKYMERYGYPDLAAQKASHKQFVEKVEGFKSDFESGKMTLSITVSSFVKEWLTQHIVGTDKKYTDFFHAKGVS